MQLNVSAGQSLTNSFPNTGYQQDPTLAQIGATAVERADDGRVEVPHLVGSSRSQADFRLGRVHAQPRPTPTVLSHQVAPSQNQQLAYCNLMVAGRSVAILIRPYLTG